MKSLAETQTETNKKLFSHQKFDKLNMYYMFVECNISSNLILIETFKVSTGLIYYC